MRFPKAPPIYVETLIRAPLEAVWEKTQNPVEHEKWDIRFSTIEYLPRASEADPQRFLYETRIGFGLKVSGAGESTGERLSDSERTSALRFWSDHPFSLIRTGSGYWRYSELPDNTTRFLTRYDYQPRFGLPGAVFDRFVFRPIMGRATAWGFDCLRLWLEKDLPPGEARLRFWADLWIRGGLGVAWIYQGLVPKILFPASGERDILLSSGITGPAAEAALWLIGGGQILIGLLFLFLSHPRFLYILTLALLAALGVGALFTMPGLFTLPFNPAALTFAMAGLAGAGYVTASAPVFPRAGRCRRKPGRKG